MFSSATVATCYVFCTNNRFTTVWHTYPCKRQSCDMIAFLHQQSLYNSLTYSCFQAPQLRHVTFSAPTIALQQFDIVFDILMFSSATVATCYAFCTNNCFTTVWQTHVFKRHSCDMLRFLHQQSLYNSLTLCLTYSCFQAPQLRHVTFSAPTIALHKFDILLFSSATVATCYAFCTNNRFTNPPCTARYMLCTNNRVTTAGHTQTHVFNCHSCDRIRLLHQQARNSLTYSCFKRHNCDMIRLLHQSSLYKG